MIKKVDNSDFYNPFETMSFTYDRCFICGKILDENNYSEEHIYPKWLQRKFNLWNKELILLNGTKIQYKNLKIPCCKECNNHLSKEIESPIKEAVELGYNEFVKLDKTIIFKWLNKLSYGMLFKELSLKKDIKDSLSESIFTKNELKEHETQYILLQSIIYKTVFINNPYSILIFKINPINEETYWAMDNIITSTFFMRLNDIGIIANLMDNGCLEEYFLNFTDIPNLLLEELIPIQYAELCAAFFYKSALFNRNPLYNFIFGDEIKDLIIISDPISGVAFDDWNHEVYAHYLEKFWQQWSLNYKDIYVGNNLTLTYLRNEDGSFKNLLKIVNN